MNGWISVEDRLPEDGCLIYLNNAVTCSDMMISGFYEHGEGVFFDDDGRLLSGVTHWQPLPEPPKRAKQ